MQKDECREGCASTACCTAAEHYTYRPVQATQLSSRHTHAGYHRAGQRTADIRTQETITHRPVHVAQQSTKRRPVQKAITGQHAQKTQHYVTAGMVMLFWCRHSETSSVLWFRTDWWLMVYIGTACRNTSSSEHISEVRGKSIPDDTGRVVRLCVCSQAYRSVSSVPLLRSSMTPSMSTTFNPYWIVISRPASLKVFTSSVQILGRCPRGHPRPPNRCLGRGRPCSFHTVAQAC